jgi:quercetin dioxygenase-like cupin family protein
MDAQKTGSTPVVVPHEQGRVLRAFGEEIILHLDGKQTGGKLTMWTEFTPPGGGPPPHYHLNEEESFLVQEGRISFLVEGRWQEAEPGGVAFMPRTVVHAFKNVGDKPSRMLVTTSPSGFETFFARCAEEFAKPGGPDMNRIVQVSAEHGIHFVNT